LSDSKECYPKCQNFRCTQNALSFRGKTAWCQLADDVCILASCNYASCKKHQLLEGGICGLSIKRKTKERSGPEDFPMEEFEVKGKLARKLGERKIF